jgi:hypothetical protein
MHLANTTALLLCGAALAFAGAPAKTEPPKSAREASAPLFISAPGSDAIERPEAAETTVVVLPGAAEAPEAPPRLARPRPAGAPPAAAETSSKLAIPEPPRTDAAVGALLNKSQPAALATPPATARAGVPQDFEKDPAFYLQRRLGVWREDDAYRVLGASVRNRVAFDADKQPDGRIFAYADPSKRYREFELDFDRKTGYLRSIFIYPWRMKWDECRKMWGGDVTAAEAANGRRFYSYENRRLDVLVDGAGQVISLGLY